MSKPTPDWNDEQIHAFVDGELDASQAARLERDSQDDAALAQRISQQRALRARLRRQFDPVLEEPIPQRLRDALDARAGGTVTPIGANVGSGRASRARTAWSVRKWGAIAATLVLGVLTGSQLRDDSGVPIAIDNGELVAAGSLDQALSSRISAATSGSGAVQIGISVRTSAGEYCRTFMLPERAAGLACRRNGQWRVDILGSPAAADGGATYRQAASSLSPAVISALERAGAGEPLTAEQEGERVQTGWDPAP